MKKTISFLVALGLGTAVLSASSASANSRPDYCPVFHDHRVHHANYYDYYPKRSRKRKFNRRYSDYHKPRSKVVFRETYPTRYHARVTVVEEVYYTRSGREQYVCSVIPKGPEAYYIPKKRLKHFAYKGCSDHARIQYL